MEFHALTIHLRLGTGDSELVSPSLCKESHILFYRLFYYLWQAQQHTAVAIQRRISGQLPRAPRFKQKQLDKRLLNLVLGYATKLDLKDYVLGIALNMLCNLFRVRKLLAADADPPTEQTDEEKEEDEEVLTQLINIEQTTRRCTEDLENVAPFDPQHSIAEAGKRKCGRPSKAHNKRQNV